MLGCNTPEDPETEVSPSTEIEVLYDPTDMRPRPSALNAPPAKGQDSDGRFRLVRATSRSSTARGRCIHFSDCRCLGRRIDGLWVTWRSNRARRRLFLGSIHYPHVKPTKTENARGEGHDGSLIWRLGEAVKRVGKKVAFLPSSWVQWKITNKWNPGNSYWRDHFPTEPWWLEEG